MKQKIWRLKSLQLFAEGEGGEAAETAAEEAPQAEASPQAEGAAQRYGQWIRQAEAAKQIYPNLDLAQEVKNPMFAHLLRSGIDVGSAYLVTHQHQIIPAAMQYGVRSAGAKIASRIAANRARPAENGMGTTSAAVTKPDVSRMTKADRQQIARRVAAGERIVF